MGTNLRTEPRDRPPHLPVPSLEDTRDFYLKSLVPFSLPTFEAETFFESIEAKTLQERLVMKSKETENWMTDWWREKAYLSTRESLVTSTNVSMNFEWDIDISSM